MEYTALAVQGDLRRAAELLEATSPHEAVADAELAYRFRQRFVLRNEPPEPPSGSPLVDTVLAAYRNYWNDALLDSSALDAEHRLRIDIERALRTAGAPAVDPSGDVFAYLRLALAQVGFHAVVDFAPPLQDLIVWTEQRSERFAIDLGDEAVEVDVRFLSGFLSQGWKHYASLELATTTGWVDEGRLYCVEWAYRPGSEAFEVSFLKHEGRHLADYRHFPGLDADILEYRAKLTELAFAKASLRRLLDDFAAKSAADSGSPHAEANSRVLAELSGELSRRGLPGDSPWMEANARSVNAAALDLLQVSTQQLRER